MPEPVRLAREAMATRFELVIADATDARPRREWPAVAEAALDVVSEWDDRLNRFAPGSLVSTINRDAARRAVPIDGETMALLAACHRLWRETSGAFDPTIGALMRQHGLHPPATTPLPVAWGFAAVELDTDRCCIHFTQPNLELDFGAVGKGVALDDAAAELRSLGVTSALAHGGTSSVIAIGAPPETPGWTIALGSGPESARVTLADRALAMSAWDGRSADGGSISHVIDPRTGAPASSRTRAAVLAPSALDADAWATALLILGERPPQMPPDITSILPPSDRAEAWRIEGPDAGLVSAPPTRPRGEHDG